jgi:hypothetical protein
MRYFFIIYCDKFISIPDQKSGKVSRKLPEKVKPVKSETLSRILQGTYNLLFKLSWSHYVELIKMDQKERNFYEVEAINNNWSIRELRRQYNSSLFERVALSKNKEEVLRLAS